MEVEDFLPGVGAGVAEDVAGAGAQFLLQQIADRPDGGGDLCQCCWVLQRVGHVAARNHQGVSLLPRVDVQEGDGGFVLVDELRGDLALDDPAEQAIAHGLQTPRTSKPARASSCLTPTIVSLP